MSSIPGSVAVSSTTCQTSRIWPLIGLQAMKRRQFGEFLVWTLGRAADPQGSGSFQLRYLRMARSSKSRYVWKAVRLGLIRPTLSGRYRYCHPAKAMQIFGGDPPDARRMAYVPLAEFVRDPRALTWKAALAVLRPNGYPISRAVLERITGIDRRQMWRWEGRAAVKKRQAVRPDGWLPNMYDVSYRLGSKKRIRKLCSDYGVRGVVRERFVQVFFPNSRLASDAVAKGRTTAAFSPGKGRAWRAFPVPDCRHVVRGKPARSRSGVLRGAYLPAFIGAGRRWVPRAEVYGAA